MSFKGKALRPFRNYSIFELKFLLAGNTMFLDFRD